MACATASPWLTLNYDTAGNLASGTSGTTSTYTYDAENRLKTRAVSGGSVSYTYDASGTMVRRLNADGSWTVYIGGVYEKNSDGSTVKYYGASGKAVAMRRTPATGAPTLYYTLSDHLGSVSVVTDTTGAVVASQKYWPYGAVRFGGVSQTDKLYTGQQIEPGDSALGLYNYKARFYSTVTGRFVSPDPTNASGSWMALNRFVYANDNPMKFIDPSGYDPTQQDLSNCAANIVACLELSYGGDSHNGIIFVMGLFESRTSPGDLDHYAGYAETFLERYVPGCSGRGGECWEAAKLLETTEGSDAAYKVFGLKFIASDPGGHGWEGIVGSIPGVKHVPFLGDRLPDRGLDALGKAVRDTSKFIVGVIGVSLGAGTVGKYFTEHPNVNIPFVMDSGADWDPGVIEANAAHYNGLLPNLVDSTSFWSCGCPLHGANDGLASVFYDEFDEYSQLYR